MESSSEGSPTAARGAQNVNSSSLNPQEKPQRLFGRWIENFFQDSRKSTETVNGDAGSAVADGLVQYAIPASVLECPVKDVALVRSDIVAVPIDIGLHELVDVFHKKGLSRLPVFSNSLDTPCGLIHLKDLALKHGFNVSNEPFNLNNMLRELLYVPPSMPIKVLLQKMQAERKHMALVIDEHGGVDGLVTIEDLFEQVFGDIEDEHDIVEDDDWCKEEAPGVYLCRAATPLVEFEKLVSKELARKDDEDEVDTLGGLVFLLTGRVPMRGEVVSHPSGLEIEVVDADPRRIKQLRIRVGASQKP